MHSGLSHRVLPPENRAAPPSSPPSSEKARARRTSACCTDCFRVYIALVATLLLLAQIVLLYGLYADTNTLTGEARQALSNFTHTGIIQATARIANVTSALLDTTDQEHLQLNVRTLLEGLDRIAKALQGLNGIAV